MKAVDGVLIFLALSACVCMLWWDAVHKPGRALKWFAWSVLSYLFLVAILLRLAPEQLGEGLVYGLPAAALLGFKFAFPTWDLALINALRDYFHPGEPEPPWRRAGREGRDKSPIPPDQ